ncbi:MAG: LysE family translocator [Alphaproteobacteria bacterium]|nr:LysE family translocator [Alphaproteobacteria bacterium]
MTLQTWWLYLGAVILISCTPGPNVLYVTTRSIRFGFGRAMIGTSGCLIALVIMLSASAAGLSAVLLAAPGWFEALKYAGAAYLVWLGIQTWRAPDDPLDETQDIISQRERSPWAVFRGGFLVGISNPKLLIFAAAFFPQFIAQDAPWAPQFAVLVTTFVAVEFFFYITYAASARRLSVWLARGAWRRRFNRASGAIFICFGFALLRYRP